jgi:hypothetical protein
MSVTQDPTAYRLLKSESRDERERGKRFAARRWFDEKIFKLVGR